MEQIDREILAGIYEALLGAGHILSGGMKVGESWRFEIPYSSAAFSSNPSL